MNAVVNNNNQAVMSSSAETMPSVSIRKYQGVVLYVAIIELIMVIGFFMNRGWSPVSTARRAVQTQPFHFNQADDPSLHKPAPALPVLDSQGHSLNLADKSARPQIIAFLSGCRACSLDYLRQLQTFQQQNPQLSVSAVAPENAREVGRFAKDNQVTINMFSEADTRIATSYNTAWRPRIYSLDTHARLIGIQGPSEGFEAALRRFAGGTTLVPSNNPQSIVP